MSIWYSSNFNYSENWLKFSANSGTSYQSSFSTPGSASISLTYTSNPGAASRTKRITLTRVTGDTDPSNDYVDIVQAGSTYNSITNVSYADNAVQYESGTDTYVFAYSYSGNNAYIEITFETNQASSHANFAAPPDFTAENYIRTTYDNGTFTDSSKLDTASTSAITWPTQGSVGFFDKTHGFIKYRFTSNGNLTGSAKTGYIIVGGKQIKYRINAISGADVAFATQSISAGSGSGTATVTLNSNIATDYTLTIGNHS